MPGKDRSMLGRPGRVWEQVIRTWLPSLAPGEVGTNHKITARPFPGFARRSQHLSSWGTVGCGQLPPQTPPSQEVLYRWLREPDQRGFSSLKEATVPVTWEISTADAPKAQEAFVVFFSCLTGFPDGGPSISPPIPLASSPTSSSLWETPP